MLQFIARNVRDWFQLPEPPQVDKNQLSPELLKTIKKIQVKTSNMVNDIMAGE